MTAFEEEDLPSEREFIINGAPCECIDKHKHIIEWLQDARANLDQPEVRAGCMPPLQRLNSSLSSLRGIWRIKQRVLCVPANVAVINWHDDARERTIDDKLKSKAPSIY